MSENKFEIEGTVDSRGEVRQVTDTFKLRNFVIVIKEQGKDKVYENFILFQLMQGNVSLVDDVRSGDKVKVYFNLRGKKTDKYGVITNLVAYKVDVLERNNKEDVPDPTSTDLPHEKEQVEMKEEDDDLPF